MNNDRARLLADAYHRIGPDAEDVLHIYIDGLVMALGGSSDRHLAVRDVLKKDFPNGFEEAKPLRDAGVRVVTAERGELGFADLVAHTVMSQSAKKFVKEVSGVCLERNTR